MNTAHKAKKAKKAQTRQAPRARVLHTEGGAVPIGRTFTPVIETGRAMTRGSINLIAPAMSGKTNWISDFKLVERRVAAHYKRIHFIPAHLTPNWQFPKGPAQTPLDPKSKRTAKRLARKQLGYARTGELVRVS